MTRTTIDDLGRIAKAINKAAGLPMESHHMNEDRSITYHVGHVYVEGAFDGYRLVQITGTTGGAKGLVPLGFEPIGIAYAQARAFLWGMTFAQEYTKHGPTKTTTPEVNGLHPIMAAALAPFTGAQK